MIIDLIGWIGNVFFILGCFAFAKHSIFGFYHNILGNLAYIIVSLALHSSSLFGISIILIGINIYGILEWLKKNK